MSFPHTIQNHFKKEVPQCVPPPLVCPCPFSFLALTNDYAPSFFRTLLHPCIFLASSLLRPCFVLAFSLLRPCFVLVYPCFFLDLSLLRPSFVLAPNLLCPSFLLPSDLLHLCKVVGPFFSRSLLICPCSIYYL